MKTILSAACALLLSVTAAAATPYAWTLSGSGVSGFGTLDTGIVSTLGLEVTDFTGSLSAGSGLYSGIVTMIGGDPGTPGALFLPNKVAYDNVVFPDIATGLVDGNGILMAFAGSSVVAEIALRGSENYILYIGDSAGTGTDLLTEGGLTFTLTEIAEPAPVGLFVLGLACVAGLARRPGAIDRRV